MSELSIPSKILLASFAACTFAVPVILGAAAQAAAEPRPLVRIAPDYPADALAARREGEVQLEFTIAANGTTKDIVVDHRGPVTATWGATGAGTVTP